MWTLRREAARVVVLDADDRVLLLQARDPLNPAKGVWWEIPGGGIEPGETSLAAAVRELYEETGIAQADMGPSVWQHRARYTFAGIRFDQLEHIHVARVGSVPDVARDYRPGGLESLEVLAFSGLEWWDLARLGELAETGGRIIPPWLPVELPRFLAEGAPAEPRYLGELPDLF